MGMHKRVRAVVCVSRVGGYAVIGKKFKSNLWPGSALAVLKFLVPGHLDSFELRFV